MGATRMQHTAMQAEYHAHCPELMCQAKVRVLRMTGDLAVCPLCGLQGRAQYSAREMCWRVEWRVKASDL